MWKTIDWMVLDSLTLTNPSLGNKLSSTYSLSIWSEITSSPIKSNTRKASMPTTTPTFNRKLIQKQLPTLSLTTLVQKSSKEKELDTTQSKRFFIVAYWVNIKSCLEECLRLFVE